MCVSAELHDLLKVFVPHHVATGSSICGNRRLFVLTLHSVFSIRTVTSIYLWIYSILHVGTLLFTQGHNL